MGLSSAFSMLVRVRPCGDKFAGDKVAATLAGADMGECESLQAYGVKTKHTEYGVLRTSLKLTCPSLFFR